MSADVGNSNCRGWVKEIDAEQGPRIRSARSRYHLPMGLSGRPERLRDFAERCPTAPGGVHECPAGRYIPIHPFADEAEDLARLAVSARDCRRVDAYWSDGTDVAFVQVGCASPDERHLRSGPGLYARMQPGDPPWVYLWATTPSEDVRRPEFERLLSALLETGVFENGESLTHSLSLIGAYPAGED